MALFPLPASAPRAQVIFSRHIIVRVIIGTIVAAIAVYTLMSTWRDVVPDPIRIADWVYPNSTNSSFSPVSVDPKGKSTKDLCDTFPKHMLDLVQPVLKIGYSEDPKRKQTHLDSVSACFGKDDLIIVSDLDETIGEHKVIDILAELPAVYHDVGSNPDIKQYVLQKELWDKGTLGKDEEATRQIDGWKLDRFKFLPMIERAWTMRPNKSFYFFYESDTYVFWDNAYRFLQNYDPEEPLYMGSPSPGRTVKTAEGDVRRWFANGGPGFVLSRGAIKALFHRETDDSGQPIGQHIHDKWFEKIKYDCCGDAMVGWVLDTMGILVQGYWPLFNPHPLHSIPFSDSHWCQPPITLHKTLQKDMVDLWRWEFGRRELERPLLYSDVWKFQRPGGEPEPRNNWDNGDFNSWRPEGETNSYEDCEKLCKEEGSCVQWSWRGKDVKECVLMRTIRYGVARKPEKVEDKDGKKAAEKWVDFKAGWRTDRVEKWIGEHQCPVAEWVPPSISRIF